MNTIHLTIPERVRLMAREWSKPLRDHYTENAHSIRHGEGHYYAKIGEIMTAEHFGWKYIDTYESDLLATKPDWTIARIEVKVKQRNVRPMPHFQASVAASNTSQKCDYYLFCSTIKDSSIFIVGMIPKKAFYDLAIFRKQGEPDPDAPKGSGWTFRADCFNLPYSCLRHFSDVGDVVDFVLSLAKGKEGGK